MQLQAPPKLRRNQRAVRSVNVRCAGRCSGCVALAIGLATKRILAPMLALAVQSSTAAADPNDGSVLPFAPTPSASVAAPRLQDSKHQRRVGGPIHAPSFSGSTTLTPSKRGTAVAEWQSVQLPEVARIRRRVACKGDKRRTPLECAFHAQGKSR